ncbi:MAG: U32 family peptidase [Paludibacter sp.]|nr:U32 family peptidase [Paludibacter sp.]
MRKIELLSPAKNLECGLAAINHGADAVYIGASQFGARAAAANSVEDIATLVKYAHQYRVKVLVALNTILTDDQLPEAEKLIWEIYEAGADALIIQDMGILQLKLPPIAIHASTQTDNRSVEKVKFLEDVGFSRVVLARELNLEQIKVISDQTKVELEAFVHGALCVSYSGQCYMSQANCGRSANRGQCAQYCRLPYHLLDADDNILLKNKHLLSLKDLDLSDSLEEMMNAGVTSFKIEGRLKDVDYVKNITAYYRKKLDAIFEGNTRFQKASAGRTTIFFDPNPEKSFRRGNTDYFLHGRKSDIVQLDTPKSMGEAIGKVKEIGDYYFTMSSAEKLNNGDGLCFINPHGDLTGFRVNKVDGRRVYPADMPKLSEGIWLYRNQDQAFEKILKGKTAERKVGVHIFFKETTKGFKIELTDENNIPCVFEVECDKQPAQKPEAVNDNIKNQLSKLGNTIYEATDIQIEINAPWFFPASQLSEWRRQAIEKLDEVRANSYVREPKRDSIAATYPIKQLNYLGNVTNKLSEEFYHSHGVEEIMPGFEVKAEEGVPLMFTKHCIKYTLGWCPKEGYKATFKEPLYLKNGDQMYELTFDCKLCEMRITKTL